MRFLMVCFWLVGSVAIAQAQVDAKAVLAEARELARAGRHAEAIERYQGLATAVEAQLGKQSLALVFVLRELAEQHHALGDAGAAESLYRRSLRIGEENPEAERAMLAPSLRGLGALAAGKGQLEEAESLYQRALTTLEEGAVGDSADAARILAELGLLSQLRGRVEESESLYRRALAVGESSRLPEAELATIVNNLGALCAAQDRPAEAEPLYLRALEMRERALGASHPEVAFVAKELASLYERQGRLTAAAAFYERVLKIRQASEEVDLSVSNMLQRLAAIYRLQDRPEDAERAFRRAVTIAEGILEPNHPTIAIQLNNLAVLFSDQGRYQEAEPLYLRSLEIQKQAFGSSHASIAVALVNLASLHHKQGRGSEARAEVARAGVILDARCGPDGEASVFCRDALQVYREMVDRLAAGAGTTESAGTDRDPIAAAEQSVDQTRATGPARVYRAQVASRRDRQLAEQAVEELRQAHPLVSDLQFRIARADLQDKGVWYRIQFGEFSTGAQAQALCSELARRGLDGCFVTSTPD